MTATATASPARVPLRRPDRRVGADLGVRAVLVVAAAVAVALGAPAWARAPLSIIAALAVVAAVLTRLRRPDGLRTATVLVGGGVVVLVLLGPLLNVLPGGLGAVSWGVAVGLVELAVLVAAARVPVQRRLVGRVPVAGLVWGAAAVLVLGGAVLWSVRSFETTHLAPVAVSAQRDGDRVAVTVSAGTDSGPFELDLTTAEGTTPIARRIEVGPDAPRTVSATLPAGTRGLVQLMRPGSSTPVRQLILDGGGAR